MYPFPFVPPELSVVGVAVTAISSARLLSANFNFCLPDECFHCFSITVANIAEAMNRVQKVAIKFIERDACSAKRVVCH